MNHAWILLACIVGLLWIGYVFQQQQRRHSEEAFTTVSKAVDLVEPIPDGFYEIEGTPRKMHKVPDKEEYTPVPKNDAFLVDHIAFYKIQVDKVWYLAQVPSGYRRVTPTSIELDPSAAADNKYTYSSKEMDALPKDGGVAKADAVPKPYDFSNQGWNVPTKEESVLLTSTPDKTPPPDPPLTSSYVPKVGSSAYASTHAPDSICASGKSDLEKETKCNALSKDVCASTSCCVLLGGTKCVAGTEAGPTFSEAYQDPVVQNRDYYYFQNKCYGHCK
jgi:hypothetical protein